MKTFVAWIQAFAATIGGPGLFIIAFLDSSFVSLPQINDLLVITMVIQHPYWMPYYAAMATLGSVAGCLVLHYLARKGGDAFIRRRFKGRTFDRATRLVHKYGALTLVIPALLPPPAPFKLFVLAAGVAKVRPVQFVVALIVARGARYLALGILAIYYGDAAIELMRTHGRIVALVVVGMLLAAVAGYWLFQRRAARS